LKFLRGKRRAATTGRFRIGIINMEERSAQFFFKIDGGTVQEIKGNVINNNLRIIFFEQVIVFL